MKSLYSRGGNSPGWTSGVLAAGLVAAGVDSLDDAAAAAGVVPIAGDLPEVRGDADVTLAPDLRLVAFLDDFELLDLGVVDPDAVAPAAPDAVAPAAPGPDDPERA